MPIVSLLLNSNSSDDEDFGLAQTLLHLIPLPRINENIRPPRNERPILHLLPSCSLTLGRNSTTTINDPEMIEMSRRVCLISYNADNFITVEGYEDTTTYWIND
jgi:hypothetical protein